MNLASRLDMVLKMAEQYQWIHVSKHDWCFVFVNTEKTMGVNVYWNSKNDLFTVQTWMNHPKKGKTQLNRKDVSIGLLGEIFKNPRIHTKKGYYLK